jgi:hypothetical protein
VKTPLDDSANESDESVLDRLSYDGSTLSVEIAFLKHEKQFNPYRMTKSQFARYKVTFTNTRAFLVIEELSAAVADLITGKDEGIIAQQVDNPDLLEH